ncbi:phosphoenolpyruvate synthase [Methanohalobium evestigatum Z-7303]|uniref:Phosphoenolpyruvate synthase n=1 Tax=Methanohalobium evestigatum (strain ATCC BAA-1072 / DSM 3721 / NBRC 107634 / OCM 161 / Z-7303) TaxID=644295 RepID=D7E917_METEZ|nr:phosphoenolpyruvate synthase [Methanohalobium evestigatum]ADI73965.1 phosphoenolpyruvate synthase [Methanohalobium evestigatum Z-7303]
MKYIQWFEEITMDDVPVVGGKNASLGEMYRKLVSEGINIPNGFAVTADAYWHVLESGGVLDELKKTMDGLDITDVSDLSKRGKKARNLILDAGIPQDLWDEIKQAYDYLCEQYGPNTDVAVRSSATAEDLPNASFAGQQETYLNIHGYHSLKDACIRCFASLFTDRAITYRENNNFDHFKVGLSIGIMKMVRSDLASSGVIFTLDTETGFRDVVLITGSYGLGENVVQGQVNPDEFYVFKPTFKKGYSSIISKYLGNKEIKMVYGRGESKTLTRNVNVPDADRKRFCINNDEILTLAGYAIKIEDYYSRYYKKSQPMDIEWAKDGETGQIFIVQARPETVQSQKDLDVLETYTLKEKSSPLIKGKSIGDKIASGTARVISDVSELSSFKPGEILIADTTTPDWEPVMKTAGAIVTNKGGRTSHAAIVSRELGVPAVVGAVDENGLESTEKIQTGNKITVSCAEGDVGYVYDGELSYDVEKTSLKEMGRPETKMMMNIGNPEIAFSYARIPNDGVGLARLEFIISSYIKVHPMALIHPEKIEDENVMKKIDGLTAGYSSREEYFVDKLSQGVGMLAAAFYPNPVVVRMSDFKSNEYANLIGGEYFEIKENNPMLGFRGASRYTHDNYREGFSLECKAMKRVRDEMGLTNLVIMIPFCRTIKEGENVIKELENNGLKRGENGLEVYVMCEIPNNILLIDEFSEFFDGFSIGSNDLTQLTLGIDRDSDILSKEFDERDSGVKKSLCAAIQGAKRNNRHSGLCGQAPSDYPEFAEFLVKEGIDSISLNPDALMKTTLKVLETEEKLKK